MGITKKIYLIRQLNRQQKCWLFYFVLSSLVTRFALSFVAIRKLAKPMGVAIGNKELSTLATSGQIKMASEMGALMARVANNIPWQCTCLAQALCVKRLLNFYKVPSVLYIGALISAGEDNKHNQLKAHAWIDVQSKTVIGGPQHLKYQVIAAFMSLSFD